MTQALTPGTVLGDSYRLVSLLGSGGMGEVWTAEHTRLPKPVAVKVLQAATQADDEARARFRREAEIASRLGHPNIVEVLDFNTLPDGTPYLVLELLAGENLRARLKRGPLALEEAIGVMRQVASALHAAHRQGVIHRDMKPENVFLVRRDLGDEIFEQVKVLDFGISKIQGSQTVVTREAAVLGTPQYMAPEQAQGLNDRIDARTDEFALAAMTYEMLSGQPPFRGENLVEVIYKVVNGTPAPLASLVPGLPERVVTAIERALAKDPHSRYPDVARFASELSGQELTTPSGLRAPIAPAAADSLGDTVAAGARLTGPPAPSLPAPSLPDPGDALGPTLAPSSGADAIAPAGAAFAATVASDAGITAPATYKVRPSRGLSGRGLAVAALLLLLGATAAFALWRVSRSTSTPQLDPAVAASPLPADRGLPAPRDAHAAEHAPDAAPDAATVDSRAPDSRAAPGRPHRPRRDRGDVPLARPSAAALQKIAQARRLLLAGQYAEARRVAQQSLAHGKSAAALLIIAVSYCGQRDRGNARAHLQAVPRVARRRARLSCRRLGMDL